MPGKGSHIAFFLLVSLLLTAFGASASAEEIDEVSRALGLAAEPPSDTFRIPRLTSKIAENVTVVTADDISRINAHTLADVLQTVPGIQLDEVETPGAFSFFCVTGTTPPQIQLLIDDVPQTFLSTDAIADAGTIPAQMIERVEITKGPASFPWGSALGAVVNVITKSPTDDRPISGMVSASAGEAATDDVRGEASGTVYRLGYYVTAGKIRSAGLVPGTRSNFNHGFAKLTYALPSGGDLTLGAEVRDAAMGTGRDVELGLTGSGGIHYLNGYLTWHQPLVERLSLEVQGIGGRRSMTSQWSTLEGSVLVLDGADREIYQGVRAGLAWGDAEQNLNAGVEYQHADIDERELVRLLPENNFRLSVDRWAGYLNGTYTWGRLSILPGLRYDHTSDLEDAVSYTLGATLRLSESTVLRAFGARGHSLPAIDETAIINGSKRLQNVWTVQTGVESSAIPYLWFKGTLFYNDTWDVERVSGFASTGVTIELKEQIRQGVDLELRTSPLFGCFLSGGYTYSQAWDKATKAELTASETGPRQVAKAALHVQNDRLGLRGALTGNYVYWYDPELPPKCSATIWDLHLTQKLFPRKERSPEVFFSAHNIFNGAQYQVDVYRNPSRWFEGGLRYRF